jgi:hypothetical protein
MLSELRRYNNVGDVNGIIYFLKLVLSENRIQKSSAQKLCALRSNIRLNFPAAVALFKYLGIIEEKAGYLYRTESGNELIEAENLERELCNRCFKKAIAENLLDTEAIHYNISNDEYAIEKYGFGVSAALFRNILLQYRALKEQSGDLVISSEYEDIFIEHQKRNKVGISLERLKKQLENQEIQGEKAEQFVLRYEAKRLAAHPKVNKIKQISIIDVTAGYDILSFDSEKSERFDRFIEVKSYQGNPHFYWSQNEIEKARLYEEQYCIYLIDVARIEDSAYNPRIIYNPAANILGSESWIMNPTSYMVIPTE